MIDNNPGSKVQAKQRSPLSPRFTPATLPHTIYRWSVMNSLMNSDATALRLQVAGEALRILGNTRHTTYQHDIFIDEATGTYDVDCSGFVSYILGRVAPAHLDLIPTHGTEPRLLAQDYHFFFRRSRPTRPMAGSRFYICLTYSAVT